MQDTERDGGQMGWCKDKEKGTDFPMWDPGHSLREHNDLSRPHDSLHVSTRQGMRISYIPYQILNSGFEIMRTRMFQFRISKTNCDL
jgi:hypothetical protein